MKLIKTAQKTLDTQIFYLTIILYSCWNIHIDRHSWTYIHQIQTVWIIKQNCSTHEKKMINKRRQLCEIQKQVDCNSAYTKNPAIITLWNNMISEMLEIFFRYVAKFLSESDKLVLKLYLNFQIDTRKWVIQVFFSTIHQNLYSKCPIIEHQ